MKKMLFVFGTRPEAIKMIPVVNKLRNNRYCVKVCTTGQHKEMLQQVLDMFSIKPDFELELMKQNQSLSDITSSVLQGVDKILLAEKFDMVFVHGDTSTAFATSLAAFYHKLPVAHIEAGLRTYNLYNPWPEEANRQLISKLTKYHFAPTTEAAKNLHREGVENNVIITGNTVIDALYFVLNEIIYPNEKELKEKLVNTYPKLNNVFQSRYILVTGHRRETFGLDFIEICQALKQIALSNHNIYVVYPVHLNPYVQNVVREILGDVNNICLLPPLPYLEFVFLMKNSYLIITDSGGIQEEAPSLGIPVLVTRKTTERIEALQAGTIRLVGVNKDDICDIVQQYLTDNQLYCAKQTNPYGDGKASDRILEYLNDIFE
ncbi:non-hydrolyzing UDP-N-acetylglucosamine 2-epimerase [Conchiformibius kuhniae]|uniref:UDP-N-acetylglucosamine 2-epimerase (non-hydrolyzing) n=1 Tax=Conchiformibius kuhniae TaxID=211502 RepID=A0ABD8B882_9NEIS|nr:UDP-N-acetylglucosamine 2-epimerase (non-hydrolyzing) [Conchiformibius kuhniae]